MLYSRTSFARSLYKFGGKKVKLIIAHLMACVVLFPKAKFQLQTWCLIHEVNYVPNSWRNYEFLCPPDLIWGAYCFCPVCLFVYLRTTLTLAITFEPLQIETWYLACICISSGCTFWGVICQGQDHPSRSKVKYIGQKVHFHFGHSIWSNRDRHLIFGVQVHLTRLHILSGKDIRSRSFFKVKGQI